MRADWVVIGLILAFVGWMVMGSSYSYPVEHEFGPFKFTETQEYSLEPLGIVLMGIGGLLFIGGLLEKGKESQPTPPPPAPPAPTAPPKPTAQPSKLEEFKRKLEVLRKAKEEGLISEEDYRRKRDELVREYSDVIETMLGS